MNKIEYKIFIIMGLHKITKCDINERRKKRRKKDGTITYLVV